jgi:AcrR family transcriptional regulator
VWFHADMSRTAATTKSTSIRRTNSVRRDDVLAAARDLFDSEGWDRLNMVALTERLGIKGPSLYNHVDNLDGAASAGFWSCAK